jgi:hypothetical protein
MIDAIVLVHKNVERLAVQYCFASSEITGNTKGQSLVKCDQQHVGREVTILWIIPVQARGAKEAPCGVVGKASAIFV